MCVLHVVKYYYIVFGSTDLITKLFLTDRKLNAEGYRFFLAGKIHGSYGISHGSEAMEKPNIS